MPSYFPLDFMLPRIERNDNTQLAIKNKMAKATASSTNVFSETPKYFKDVRIIKHSPSKLDDALRICGDLSLIGMVI